MYKVKHIKKTCESCPAQWEGMTTNGKHIYIRYRFGSFSATVGDTEIDAVFGHGEFITWEHPNDTWAGNMSTAEMMMLTRDMLDFKGVKCVEDVKFYIYDMPKDEIIKAQPYELKSLNPLLLGKKVEVDLQKGASEITADKKRYIVDPNYKEFKM